MRDRRGSRWSAAVVAGLVAGLVAAAGATEAAEPERKSVDIHTARDAQLKHDLLGTEVAYFHDGKVQTSSFVSEGTGESAKEEIGRAHV